MNIFSQSFAYSATSQQSAPISGVTDPSVSQNSNGGTSRFNALVKGIRPSQVDQLRTLNEATDNDFLCTQVDRESDDDFEYAAATQIDSPMREKNPGVMINSIVSIAAFMCFFEIAFEIILLCFSTKTSQLT